jgi:hypothetical protein
VNIAILSAMLSEALGEVLSDINNLIQYVAIGMPK